LRTDAYYERQERVSYADTSAALTRLKRGPETAWLNEISSVPTQQALRHLDRAYRNFFEGRATYPTFHTKHGKQSAEYTTSALRWDAGTRALTLAKMDTPLEMRWSRPLPDDAMLSTVTVSRDTAGRYFVSLLVDEEIATLPPIAPTVGIDLGVHDVVALDTGEKVGNPRCFHCDEKRLVQAQKRLAKKRLGSKNREKARRAVARIHARIADRRRDFTHQLSTRLIRENQTICVESLNVKAMGKHPTLAKASHEVGWGELGRQLAYKAAWYGRTLVALDKWYPSSKRCFDCGSVHDRDVNATKNIKAAGLAVSACGEAIRPGKARPDSARLGDAGIPRL
jgi:putative transposase